MKILLYRGISPLSKLIQFGTRSVYSHAANLLNSGKVIEAWHEGVVLAENPSENHTVGTVVDIFEIVGWGSHKDAIATTWLQDQLGKGYDFRNVFAFGLLKAPEDNDKIFCSELCAEMCLQAGNPLFREGTRSDSISPGDMSKTALLKFAGQLVTKGDV